MNKILSKTLIIGAASLFLLTLSACTNIIEEVESPQQSVAEESSVLVKVPAFSIKSTTSVKTIDLFQFSDGMFVKKITVDATKDNIVEFAKKPGSRIYALAGHTVECRTNLHENDFSSMTIPIPENAYSAPVFFSAIINLPESSDDSKIELHRGVARLDIDNKDPELKVEKVSIAGAASTSHIFATDGRTCCSTSSCYCHTYEAGINGLEEQAFVLFETSSPITVTISGVRNGKPVEISSETPAIERSQIYTICIDEGSLSKKERTYTGYEDNTYEKATPDLSVKVKKWEDGDVESGKLDLSESAIDIGRSKIPSGVSINTNDNTVTIPAAGVSGMILAFTMAVPISLGSVLSDTEGVTVTQMEPTASDSIYVSRFRIEVARQPKGAQRYQATVFFKGSSGFFINLEVEPSPYQIPTVRIGGHDWMCFNAVSSDPEDQIYLPKGMSVERMYHDHFSECVGNFFQYGRPNPFSPWKAYDPKMTADQKRDIPWTTRSMTPLPKGYHVPSASEWEDLIPNGTVIPSSYRSRSGDSIRVGIVTIEGTLDDTPSAATNAQKYKKRCVVFESLTSGERLALPLAGIKTNSSAEIPTQPNFRFDTKSGYWMQEERSIMTLEYDKLGDGQEGIQLKSDLWNADGFVMVRGVKD